MAVGPDAVNTAVCCGTCNLYRNKLNLQQLVVTSKHYYHSVPVANMNDADTLESTLKSAESFNNDAAL